MSENLIELRPAPTPADRAAYQDWCVQLSDGETPPMSFEDWLRERARVRAEEGRSETVRRSG